MSHSREIKEKQKLQALLQTSHADTTSKISKWLKPKKTENSETTTEDSSHIKSSHVDFLNLPIVSGSNGLSFENETDNVKIGEYLSNGNKKKGVDNKPQVQRNDSKILEALRNKMKKSANKNIRSNQNHINNNKNNNNNNNNNNPYNNNQQKRPVSVTSSSNLMGDDSDDEEQVTKTIKKKSFGLLLDSKIKKRK